MDYHCRTSETTLMVRLELSGTPIVAKRELWIRADRVESVAAGDDKESSTLTMETGHRHHVQGSPQEIIRRITRSGE